MDKIKTEKIFECEILKRSTRNLQMLLAVPMGITGAFLLINLINTSFGKRGIMQDWMPLFAVIFFLSFTGIILIWYLSRGKLNIYEVGTGQFEVEIAFPSGDYLSKKGSWACQGYFVKEYAKYGMYTKHLALSVSCEGVPFCLLRHQLGGFSSDPEGFMEVTQLFNPGGTEYWCKKVMLVRDEIRK
jgi:hypothetical protein